MFARDEERPVLALHVMAELERGRERGHAFFGFGHIELDVHVAHLVAFPSLHAGACDFDHLPHWDSGDCYCGEWKSAAMPWPPPTHMVSRPSFALRRCISCSSV